MGKKKGGGKNKLAKMSEEERARYLQHRADMEEEARRRKMQLISLYMKNKLKREEAFSRLNLAKINEEWRSILRQVKCDELKNEIEEVERLFEESLEHKDMVIRRLLNDLDEAEDLYSTLQQSHMLNIERLIEIQQQRMQYIKERFCKQRDSILDEWKQDCEMYKDERNRSQLELECVYYCLQDVADKRTKDLEEDHQCKLNDLTSAMTIKLQEITETREKQLEQLWQEYQKVLDSYVKYTESFYSEYIELRERDDENTKLIRTHCYEVAKATEYIAELKLDLENVEEEHELKVNYLENYRKDLNEQHMQLRKKLEERIAFDEEHFKFMSVTSHKVIKILEKKAKKGETLLQLSLACRKLESEREKVLPFGFDRSKMLDRSMIELKAPPDDFKQHAFSLWLNLENFWVRVNNAKLDVAGLKEEKSALEKDNARLKEKLREYLTAVTLNSGNNSNSQEYLQRRPHSMKVEKIVHIDLNNGQRFAKKKIKRRPVTCVEGNFSNAVRSMKLVEGKMKTTQISTIVNW